VEIPPPPDDEPQLDFWTEYLDEYLDEELAYHQLSHFAA
jgi:hypothetical protein